MKRREFIALAGSATLAGSWVLTRNNRGSYRRSDSSAQLRLRPGANGLLPLYNGCAN